MTDSADRIRQTRVRDLPALVSVVIPVRNGMDVLPHQLDALVKQDYRGNWEVLVVDNGSADRTREVALRWSDRLPLRVVSASDVLGASAARNRGLMEARGQLVLFCDADDAVSEHWLRSMVHGAPGFDVIGGRTDTALLNDPVSTAWVDLSYSDGPRNANGFLPWVIGCNLGVWKDVADAVGGFREDYEYGGEEVDFCWRASLAGFQIGYLDDAVVHYRQRSTLRGLIKQMYAYGRSGPHLYRDYRDAGCPRSSTWQALRSWIWLLAHLWHLAGGPVRRGQWLRAGALRIGKLVGSIECRVLYL